MLRRLFEKDEVWFAVVWIIIYVVGFANADAISESLGYPKLLTVFVGLILTVIIYRFICKKQLKDYYGLCVLKAEYKNYLYFIPLIVISSVNFWNGVTIQTTMVETVFYIFSMCFVGILEEVIFRGFLFKGMCKSNVKIAIIVSSLTFGIGHIVNLLLGAPVVDTLLQLVYATAIGFCFTVIFYVSGSIYPCILSHIVVNTTSVFAIEPSIQKHIVITVIQTILSIGYGVWLLKQFNRSHTIDR